jgi:SAM-dependent methyltransferase
VANEDLFGQALVDYYDGKRYNFEMERDDGFLDEQNMMFYFKQFDEFPGSEKKALNYAKGSVLDIGVGAGRVALYLQGRGHKVLGMDISDKALEVCRLRGVKWLSKMSACDLKLKKNSFDTAIAFFNNFGLCGTMDAVAHMLERLHGVIKDDGLFLAESVDPTDTKKRVHLKYHQLNLKRGRPVGQITLRTHYRGKVGGWWDLLLVTPGEMKELCSRTGWTIWRTCTGGPMIVYVLRKA